MNPDSQLHTNPEHSGRVLDEKHGYKVVACRACDFAHLQPIPSEEDLAKFYAHLYFDTHKPTYIKTDVEEDEFQSIAYRDRLRVFERHTSGRTLLDVGCGSGHFISFASKAGWDCTGVEPSRLASEHAKHLGMIVHHGTLSSFVATGKSLFDVVHFKNVLEHVPDPMAELRLGTAMLKPGGVIYVEVPNDFSLDQEVGIWLQGETRSWICIPDHINYFGFSSLTRMVKRLGLRPLRRDTTFPMYLFLWFGLNFIRDKSAGAKAHKLRSNFEIFMERAGLSKLRRGLYRTLACLGGGRTVILYCQKAIE